MTANIGISYITEKRIGGSLDYIRKGTAGYFEKTIQIVLQHRHR
jgi:outer membrane receptor for ferrienterochelin and colicins